MAVFGLLALVFPGVTAITLLLLFGWREARQLASLPLLFWVGVLLWFCLTLWYAADWVAVVEGLQVLVLPFLFLLGGRFSPLLQRHRDGICFAVIGVLGIQLLLSLVQINGWGLAPLARLATHFWPLERFYEASLFVQKTGRATGWLSHPNLWGISTLLPGFFAVLFARSRWRWLVLPLMFGVIVTAGSRAAFVGCVVGCVALAVHLMLTRGLRKTHLLWAGLAGAGFVVILALTPFGTRFLSTLELFQSSPPAPLPRNLFQASEVLSDTFWFNRSVTVEEVETSDLTPTWRVKKTATQPNSRLQQRLELSPGRVYTLSAELYGETPEAVPGVVSWVRMETGTHSLNVRFSGSQWQARARGELELVSFRPTLLGDGWTRLVVTLKNTASEPLPFPVGFAPDQRDEVGASILVRRAQLELGEGPSPYEPTFPPDRRALRARQSAEGRLDIFQAAWQGFLQRPLLGWGERAFTGFYQTQTASAAVIAHAHNLFLQTLFAKGAVGLTSLVLLLLGLFYATRGTLGWGCSSVLLLAVLAANTFDLTFWIAHVSYLLVFLLGVKS